MTAADAGNNEIVLRLAGISKRFGSVAANDDISLTLRRGEIVGLLGENGAGKTTLMNILFGHYVADTGSIEVLGKPLPPGSPSAALAAGIGMVHQHFTLADNLTVLDNIVLGTEPWWQFASDQAGARARIAALGQRFGLAVASDAVVGSLSVGEKQRVEILKALYRNARILVLDEPTAVLTPQESAGLFATLKRFVAEGLSIIFISHKLDEITAACDRVAVLRGGKLVAKRPVGGASPAELAELMVGRRITPPVPETIAKGNVRLELDGVSARRGAQTLAPVTLRLHAGEVLGIAGVSGNGQSLLADVLSGTIAPDCGTLLIRGRPATTGNPGAMVAAGIARIPEDRHAEGTFGGMSVTENIVSEHYRRAPLARAGLIDWRAARRQAEQIIADYDVKCPSPDAPIKLLSGGNIQKLILGRVLARNPEIIIAHQPTRGLDVAAASDVHRRLQAAQRSGAAIVLISEDLEELMALSSSLAVMVRGRLSAPVERACASTERLGLMMAGEGVGHAA